jgi:hypothetical protein
MSKALPGGHYCEDHQGNHSHYAKHNCRVCILETELADLRTAQRQFPIQPTPRARPHPTRIPWHIADLAYSVYSARHGKEQSLERLAERGGFGADEMDDLLPDWRERCEALRTAQPDRDRDWILAMAHALGTDSGFNVPIVPTVEQFKLLFAAVRAQQQQAEQTEVGREFLGKIVRMVWMEWAREQPNQKPSWLQSWEELTEPEREVDRRIGERIYKMAIGCVHVPSSTASEEREEAARRLEHWVTVGPYATGAEEDLINAARLLRAPQQQAKPDKEQR